MKYEKPKLIRIKEALTLVTVNFAPPVVQTEEKYKGNSLKNSTSYDGK
jgi:hypothetical protein